jgi:hypothetical protein
VTVRISIGCAVVDGGITRIACRGTVPRSTDETGLSVLRCVCTGLTEMCAEISRTVRTCIARTRIEAFNAAALAGVIRTGLFKGIAVIRPTFCAVIFTIRTGTRRGHRSPAASGTAIAACTTVAP